MHTARMAPAALRHPPMDVKGSHSHIAVSMLGPKGSVAKRVARRVQGGSAARRWVPLRGSPPLLPCAPPHHHQQLSSAQQQGPAHPYGRTERAGRGQDRAAESLRRHPRAVQGWRTHGLTGSASQGVSHGSAGHAATAPSDTATCSAHAAHTSGPHKPTRRPSPWHSRLRLGRAGRGGQGPAHLRQALHGCQEVVGRCGPRGHQRATRGLASRRTDRHARAAHARGPLTHTVQPHAAQARGVGP
jgi:hypothetical protein